MLLCKIYHLLIEKMQKAFLLFFHRKQYGYMLFFVWACSDIIPLIFRETSLKKFI